MKKFRKSRVVKPQKKNKASEQSATHISNSHYVAQMTEGSKRPPY